MTIVSIFDDIKTGIRIALLSVYHGITHIKLLGFLFVFTALFLAVGISPFFFEPITDIFSTLRECTYPGQLCTSTFFSFFTALIALVLKKTLVTVLLFGLMLYACEVLQKSSPSLREELKKSWQARRALLTLSLIATGVTLVLSLLINLIPQNLIIHTGYFFGNLFDVSLWIIQLCILAILAHGEQSVTQAITTALRLLQSYFGTIITSYLTMFGIFYALGILFIRFTYTLILFFPKLEAFLNVHHFIIIFLLAVLLKSINTIIEVFLVTALYRLYRHTQNR